MIRKSDKIYIAGHRGMVGSACWRALELEGYTNLIGKTSKEIDLRDQKAVNDFIQTEKPVAIIDAAARVGGILANDTYPYEFLMDNMLIQNNLIRSAHLNNIEKFIFLGSSCIYPKFAQQPLKEEYLLTDALEPTNQWYALAKISGVKLIESLRIQFNRDYISLMPTNLYGPYDNFDSHTSHVIPGLIRRFYEALKNKHSELFIWGDGTPLREFLHVDDLAKACIALLKINTLSQEDWPFDKHVSFLNVGSGEEVSIFELAKMLKFTSGFEGEILFDTTKPNGTPRKLLDSSKIRLLGWGPSINLDEGLNMTYEVFKRNDNS